MSCDTFLKGDSIIRRLDPRLRILAALAFSIQVAVSGRLEVLAAALAAAVVLALLTDLPLRPILSRILYLNLFLFVLFLLLPLSTPGESAFRIGSLSWSRAGLGIALAITLKANTIVIAYTALMSTIEPVILGHALHRLMVPAKLVHLFLFTMRYVEVIHHELERLLTAMKVRCFRPRFDKHTFRSYGYMVGMLLVNSLDRSDRIVAAMKCRGFQGRFHVLDKLSYARRDLAFSSGFVIGMLILGFWEWI